MEGGQKRGPVTRTSAPPPEERRQPAITVRDRFAFLEDLVLAFFFFSLSLAFSTKLLVSFTLPKLVVLRISALVLSALWIYRIAKGKVRVLPALLLWSGVLMAVWWVLATPFSLHLPTAIHGVYGRYNGLFTHGIWLLLFFITATMVVDRNRAEGILKFFLIALVPVSVYAIIQFLGLDPVMWTKLQGRSASTIGHPVMLSALLGLGLPFVIVFVFRAEKAQERAWWLFTALVYSLAVMTTLSRGPMIGIMLSSGGLLFLHLRGWSPAKPLWLAGAVGLGAACVTLLVMYHGGPGKVMERVSSRDEITLRLVYYKSAVNMIADHPVTGLGFENFRNAYPRYRLAEENPVARDISPTMVHNGYLQTAVTNGVPGLILYLWFLGVVIFFLFKGYMNEQRQEVKLLKAAFLASAAGFLIQDLTGWLEISQTTFFWILLGLGTALNLSGMARGFRRAVSRYVLLGLGGCFFATLLWLSADGVNRLYGDHLFWKAQTPGAVRDWRDGEKLIQEGLEVTRGEAAYLDMAASFYERVFGDTGDEEALNRAVTLTAESHRNNPYDIYVLLHRVELETARVRNKGVAPGQEVQHAVARVLDTDRNNPTVYETVARLRLAEKRVPEALEMLGKARALGDMQPGYHLTEANILRELQDHAGALKAYGRVIELAEKKEPLRPEWLQAKQGRASILARRGDRDSALVELREAAARFPRDPVTYLMGGDILLSAGELARARELFRAALQVAPGNALARERLERVRRRIEAGGAR